MQMDPLNEMKKYVEEARKQKELLETPRRTTVSTPRSTSSSTTSSSRRREPQPGARLPPELERKRRREQEQREREQRYRDGVRDERDRAWRANQPNRRPVYSEGFNSAIERERKGGKLRDDY